MNSVTTSSSIHVITDSNQPKKLKLESVRLLFDVENARTFFVPSYQRGYRWKDDQVSALLSDLTKFHQGKPGANDWYCLQPFVVAQDKDQPGRYRVVDGQQRLTTLWIILKALGADLPKCSTKFIDYESRGKTWARLNQQQCDEIHVDFYFIDAAFQAVKNWDTQQAWTEEARHNWLKTIFDKCKMIWYEVDHHEELATFHRLNSGKIALNDAELVKALYMLADNGISEQEKMEISKEWEFMESTLRDDRFWYMLNTKEWSSASRIEFLLGLVADPQGSQSSVRVKIFSTFESNNCKESLLKNWAICRDNFWQFQSWYEDVVSYHYVGMLRMLGYDVSKIMALQKNGEFKQILALEIIKNLELDKRFQSTKEAFNYGNPDLRNFFILFNAETLNIRHRSILDQNQSKENSVRYQGYERFPFDLCVKNQWDIEHIHSQTDKPLDKENDIREWLKAALYDLALSDELEKRIHAFLARFQLEDFANLYDDIVNLVEEALILDSDSLANLTLLDCGTNRSYKNALFPTKRRKIIENDRKGQFIPLCTRQLFLKLYTPGLAHVGKWQDADGKGYMDEIHRVMRALYTQAGRQDNFPSLIIEKKDTANEPDSPTQ